MHLTQDTHTHMQTHIRLYAHLTQVLRALKLVLASVEQDLAEGHRLVSAGRRREAGQLIGQLQAQVCVDTCQWLCVCVCVSRFPNTIMFLSAPAAGGKLGSSSASFKHKSAWTQVNGCVCVSRFPNTLIFWSAPAGGGKLGSALAGFRRRALSTCTLHTWRSLWPRCCGT